MKKACLFVLCALLILTAVGCGTIKGIGEDISALGGWLIRGSDSATSPTEK